VKQYVVTSEPSWEDEGRSCVAGLFGGRVCR